MRYTIHYNDEKDRNLYFTQISAARFAPEPYLLPFAKFTQARDKAVLEISVGAGVDFKQWCKYAAHADGVDLSQKDNR